MTEQPPADHQPHEPQGHQARHDHDHHRHHREDDRGHDRKADRARNQVARTSPAGHVFCGQIGDERIQLAVRARSEGCSEPLLEFLGKEPSIGGGVTQTLRDQLSVGVRCPERRPPCHAREASVPSSIRSGV